VERLREGATSAPSGKTTLSETVVAIVDEKMRAFDAALDDDLNTPNALAAVFELVSALNQLSLTASDCCYALAQFEAIDSVLAIFDHRVRSGLVTKERLAQLTESLDASIELGDLTCPDQIEIAIAKRQIARKNKAFQLGDQIRESLKTVGVQLEDLPNGIRWKLL
jgi:cysteinyl-tRNA synthetase